MKTKNLTFKEAFELMLLGFRLKRPSWGGYWFWDEDAKTIKMRTKDNEYLDIRETENVEYTVRNTLADDWMTATSMNCPMLGGVLSLDFNTALSYLKRGFRMTRKAWVGDNSNVDYLVIEDNVLKVQRDDGEFLSFYLDYEDITSEDWIFAELSC